MSCHALRPARVPLFALGLLAGCFGRTPPTELVCPGGTPLSGGRCVAALDAGALGDDGGLDLGPDLGPFDGGPLDIGPADGGVPDASPPDAEVTDLGGPGTSVAVLPARLDFGDVRLSGTKVLELRLSDTDGRRRQVNLRAPDPRLRLDRSSLVLPPRGEVVVRVAFVANSLDPLRDAIEITSCGGLCPVELETLGRGVTPGVECAPVDAGTIPQGTCVDATSACVSLVDQEGVFEPGPVTGPVAGELRTGRFVVGPRQRFDVRLEVCAPEAGRLEGSFLMRVTFPVGAVDDLRVPVSVEGRREVPPACALVGPVGSVDFGRVAVGSNADRDLVFMNRGQQDCQISQPQLSGTHASDFRVRSMTPIAVPPGGVGQLAVRFTPQGTGSRTGRLTVSTNDPAQPSLQTSLLGRAIGGGPITRYVISERPINGISRGPGRSLSFSNDDDGFAVEQLPFPFAFLGRSVTQVFISTNGFIGFTQNGIGSLSNRAIPAPNTPNELVAWFWDDLILDAPTSNVSLRLRGLAPNRELILTYRDIRRFGGGGVNNADTRLEAQIVLQEGTDVIEVRYGRAVSTVAASQFDASIGWENATGSRGGSSVTCSPRCGLSDWPTNRAFTYTPQP